LPSSSLHLNSTEVRTRTLKARCKLHFAKCDVLEFLISMFTALFLQMLNKGITRVHEAGALWSQEGVIWELNNKH
jgi:hypothetical protein